MAAKKKDRSGVKKSRGITFDDDLWKEVSKNASLINYNNNLFMETCIRSIIDMINHPEKRKLPLIVRLIDEAKANAKDLLTVPLEIVDTIPAKEQAEELNGQVSEEQ